MTNLARRAPITLSLLFTLLTIFSVQLPAQLLANPPHPDDKRQMASLRPGLVWQRSSPPPGAVEGPVLYQLLFSASGTPGTLAKFDSNPRHLTNSLITDNGTTVAIGGMSILGSSGVITFADTQTFAGARVTGTVASADGATHANNASTANNALFLNGVSTYARTDQNNSFTTGTQLIQTGAASTVGLAVQGPTMARCWAPLPSAPNPLVWPLTEPTSG